MGEEQGQESQSISCSVWLHDITRDKTYLIRVFWSWKKADYDRPLIGLAHADDDYATIFNHLMKNHKCKSTSAIPIFEMFESLLNYGVNAIRILQIQGDTSRRTEHRTKNEFLFLLGNIPQFSFMIVNFNTLVFRYTTFSLWILSLICIVIFASKTYSFSCLVGEKTGFSPHKYRSSGKILWWFAHNRGGVGEPPTRGPYKAWGIIWSSLIKVPE